METTQRPDTWLQRALDRAAREAQDAADGEQIERGCRFNSYVE